VGANLDEKRLIKNQILDIENQLVVNRIIDQKPSIERIVEEVVKWMSQRKYGNIQINFFAGGVSNINLNESVKITEKKGA